MEVSMKNEKMVVELRKHNLRIVEEALSPENVCLTSEELKRAPNIDTTEGRNTFILHLIHSGLAPRFKPKGA